jgi:hypothetical protein
MKDHVPALTDSSIVRICTGQDSGVPENNVKGIHARGMNIAVGHSVRYHNPWFAYWKGMTVYLLEQVKHIVRVNEDPHPILSTIYATNFLVQSRTWANYIKKQYLWQFLFAMKQCVAGLYMNERFVARLLKCIKIAIQVHIAMRMPTTAALSEFDLNKIGPTVYGQLAQGTVIACFAVVLTRAIHQQPINTFADGPLSSLSSLRWLWMNRGSKSQDDIQFVNLFFDQDVDPKLMIRRQILAAIPGIAITLSSFVVYLLLSVDDRHQRNWAMSISISGIASELLRLVATWLAFISMKTKPHHGKVLEHYLYPHFWKGDDYEIAQERFIHWRPFSTLRSLRPFSEFTDSRKKISISIQGHYLYTWYWNNSTTFLASLSLFCIAVSLALFSTGALVASGDTSMAAASLGILLCLSACGLFRAASPKESGVLEYAEYSSVTRLVEVVAGIMRKGNGPSDLWPVRMRWYIQCCLTADKEFTIEGNRIHQAFKIETDLTIDMHDVYEKCTTVHLALKRIMVPKDETTGRCTLLEIADSLYCRALLLIRHAHSCAHGNYKLKGSKCNVDASEFMSSILLASGHVECPEVHDILSNIKAWMNHEDLLWSIIGAHIKLDMMLLPHLRRQLESPNTLDLALRVCHMKMYENTPSGDLLEAVPTVMYYLLIGNTALAYATASVVQHAIYKFGTIDMTLALDQVIVRLDKYTINCQGKLHDWPGGFIPIVDMSVNANQPRYYTLAKATFAS